jgi:hypothetical protein
MKIIINGWGFWCYVQKSEIPFTTVSRDRPVSAVAVIFVFDALECVLQRTD